MNAPERVIRWIRALAVVGVAVVAAVVSYEHAGALWCGNTESLATPGIRCR